MSVTTFAGGPGRRCRVPSGPRDVLFSECVRGAGKVQPSNIFSDYGEATQTSVVAWEHLRPPFFPDCLRRPVKAWMRIVSGVAGRRCGLPSSPQGGTSAERV